MLTAAPPGYSSSEKIIGQCLVDSTLTLSIETGLSVNDISQNAVANLGWDEVRLHKPVVAGDTIYAESEILSKRESKSNPMPALSR